MGGEQTSDTKIILAQLRLVLAYWLGLIFFISPMVDKTYDTADGIIVCSLIGSGLISLGGNAKIDSSGICSTVIGKIISDFLQLLYSLSILVVLASLIFSFVGFIIGLCVLFVPSSEPLQIISALPFLLFVVALEKSKFFVFMNQEFRGNG